MKTAGIPLWLLVSLIGLLLSACGDNSDRAQKPTLTYLFFSNDLSAVDPNDPANPMPIEAPGTAVMNVIAVEHGNFNAASQTVSDRHYRSVIYRKTADNTLWRVSTLRENFVTSVSTTDLNAGPVPKQLSNATNLTRFCLSQVQADYADHDAAQLVYRLPGADAICHNTDDTWHMVKMGMDANASPYPAFEPLTVLYDNSSGAIRGWLVKDGNNIYAYDADFANPVLVSSFSTTAYLVMTTPDGRVVLRIDNDLYFYRPNAAPASLSASVYTIASTFGGPYVWDRDNVYFRDGTEIRALPLDESGPSALVIDEGVTSIQLRAATDSYLIYQATGKLQSVLKTGGSATILNASWTQFVGVAGSYVYYNTFYYSPADTRWYWSAHAVMDDGSNPDVMVDAAWVGRSDSRSQMFGNNGRNRDIDKLFLKKGASAPFNLSAWNPSAYSEVANLGDMLATMGGSYDPFINRLANQDFLLGRAYDSATGSVDIFMFNQNKADSLVVVTSTNGKHEALVGASGCSLQTNAKFDPMLIMLLVLSFVFMLRSRRQKALRVIAQV